MKSVNKFGDSGERQCPAAASGKMFSALAFIFSCCAALAVTGCSSGRPQLGAVSVTDPSGTVKGQLSSVIVNSTAAVSVAVNGDQTNLGVDWSLNCQGSSVVTYTVNVCGTLNPEHVGSNINMLYTAPLYVPIGNTVTLTATVTSDPAEQSSVTLTIVPEPITIAFTGNLPPTVMGASETGFPATAQIAATVTNDPIAAGVNWTATCGSSACGSFSPALAGSGNATTYTAPSAIPSGGTVKVIATSVEDSTKSVSASITIHPIQVSILPASVAVPEAAAAALTPTVLYDASSAGVDWSAPACGSGSDCGSIAPSHTASGVAATYTAPKSIPAGGGKVTVTASSTACTQNPGLCTGDADSSATATLIINVPPPIQVSVSAAQNSMQLGGSTALMASVTNDFSNSGVTWDCSPGTCQPPTSTTLPFTTTFSSPNSAPPGNAVTVRATSIADATKSGTTTIKIVPTISVSFTAAPTTVTAGVAAAFTATVTNDIAPGGLDWTATGCGSANCGTFNSGNPSAPNHTASGASISYTAPVQLPASTVTITATATASETVSPLQSASTPVMVTPVTYVKFVPFAPSALGIANPSAPILVSLIAVAANDPANAGVDWSVCSSASTCGEFLVAPGIPATATTLAIPPVYSANLHAASGQVVSYLPPTEKPASGSVKVTVTSTGDKTANPSNPASASQVIAMVDQTAGVTGVALKGVVQAGNLAVAGASVQLFATGSAGYGSAGAPLVISNGSTLVTTGADGSFSIPAGYVCPAQTTELYLVALGGAPGGVKNNPQLGLMTAVGECSNLNSSVSLAVNEATTIASTWALVPFTGADYAHIGSSSSNYSSGFANAFATVNNLVDIATGQALTVTPAGYGTVPQAEIYTLADAIDTCAATAGGAPGDGSPCSAFFEASNVSPLGMGVPANSPTSILQAVLELAQYPSNVFATPTSGTPLFNIASAVTNPPFSPILSAAPFDWSIGISFTGGGLGGSAQSSAQSSAMAIDAAGNVWIANRRTSSVTELNSLGAPLSPFTTAKTLASAGGFKGGGLNHPQSLAIDQQGSAWALNSDSSLSELDFTGAPVTGSPFSGAGTMTGNALAIDGAGFLWVTDSGSPGDAAEYAGYNAEVNGKPVANGTPVSPAGGYVNGINAPNGGLAIDGSGTVWILNGGNFAAAELNSTNGSLIQTDYGYVANPTTGDPVIPLQGIFSSVSFGVSMAIDNAGDVYIPNPNTGAGATAQVYELLTGGSALNDGGIGQSLSLGIPSVNAPIAIDGAGHLWLETLENTNNGEPPSLAELSGSGGSLNGGLSAPGVVGPNLSSGPESIAVDGAGNVWVLIDNIGSTVTEFVGVATPVVTPLSLGVATKSLGKKP